MMGLTSAHHKVFFAIAGGIFVAVVAESFVAQLIAPVLAPLKITYS